MRGSRSSSLLLLIAITLLYSSLPAAQCVAGEAGGGGHSGGGRLPEPVRWEVVTKRNFSSQIRLNPRLLLMITVPWSGESRSLMKEVARLVAGKEEELGYLKLAVLFRNSEKMIADALGASEGITLFYYHHSISYKYQGRLRAQNILSSVYHFMLLQTEEVPLKPLQSQQDLENFFRSTDKAVLLLEFCGWAAELLRRRNYGENETTETIKSPLKTDGLFEEIFSRESGGKMAFEKMINQKIQGLESEELTCGIESGIADSPLLGQRTNQSDSQGTNYRSDDTEMSCTVENFHKFKSFFLEFMKISREYFLPPERHRFGLISERSLLSFLDVGNPETWLVVVQFSGCSNCSVIVHEGDDLRSILQTHHTLIKELDVDGSLESVFPANRPSVILFIDRSSDSSKLRGESKSALQILRKFVNDNHLSDHVVGGKFSSNLKSFSGKSFPSTWSQVIADHSFRQNAKDSATPKLVRFQDNMAIMITNKGQNIALDATADSQGNALYNILANLLNRKKPAVETKETKISLLAKEAGFQLLSDDFEVQVADSSPSHYDESQLNYISENAITSMEAKTSKQPQESNEEHGASNEILLDSNGIASFVDEKQPEHGNTETFLQKNQERVTCSESKANKLTTTLVNELDDSSRPTQVNEDDRSGQEMNMQSLTCPAKYLEKEPPTGEYPIEEQNIDLTDCSPDKTCSDVFKENLTDVTPGKDLLENDADEVIKSRQQSVSDEWPFQQLQFKGSFFFSDGGYLLLRSLTGGENVPSLVILDPVSQHHYVYSGEAYITYTSLVNFVKEFLNGTLTPYRRSASPFTSTRESPRPPFVNLDFHEADSIPRVTADTFCELVIGYKPCEMGNDFTVSQIQNFRTIWKKDVLVLFSTSWCGFCQRVELVVREVYRALTNFSTMLKSESKNWDSMHILDKAEDSMPNGLPSIFLMDCTLNDCGAYLKLISKKEVYPALLLFPAENKTAITFEGDMSVVNIIEFLLSHGRNSQYLTRRKGFLWTHSWQGSKNSATFYDETSPTHQGAGFSGKKYDEILLNTAARDDQLFVGSHRSNSLHNGGHHVVAGSVLAATDKLLDAVPFDNSTILIVMADKDQGFQGMIINKRISWDIFKELDPQLEPLKQAPLFYGGPVRTHGLPLVSLSRKAIEGYVEVTASIYFGNPLATRLMIERIQSGDQSVQDFWFFLGYSSWAWNQLFDELAAGAWYLSESTIRNVDWLDR